MRHQELAHIGHFRYVSLILHIRVRPSLKVSGGRLRGATQRFKYQPLPRKQSRLGMALLLQIRLDY